MSLTYAVAAIRTARRGALAQQLNAIESLASIDTICLDKTGTLTEGSLRVARVVPADGVDETALQEALGRYAASASLRNATIEALGESFPGPGATPDAEVRSRRGGAGAGSGSTGRRTCWAPPKSSRPARSAVWRRPRRLPGGGSSRSRRRGSAPGWRRLRAPPAALRGLVVLAERLRPDARSTVEFFRAQGVELKVVSGMRRQLSRQSPKTSGSNPGPVDGRELPDSDEELRRVAVASSVIGRVQPETKRRIVEELTRAGRNVAMVGDGVNDVPALKAARLAIVQGSGVQMAKAVADLVLVRGDFGAVPGMVAEGRTIFRNVRRVSKLFVAKSAFAAVLILSIGVTPTAYPLLPRHLTLAAFVTVGIPAFILALAPSSGPFGTQGFLRDVARFAVPGGTAAALGVVASYLAALYVFGLSLVEARTVATTVLIVVGLYLVVVLEAGSERRLRTVVAMSLALAAFYFAVMSIEAGQEFFELSEPDPLLFFIAAIGSALPIAGLCATDDRFVPRPRAEEPARA